MFELLPLHGHVAPIAVEGDIVKALQDAQLLLELVGLERPGAQSASSLRPLGQTHHRRVRRGRHVHVECVELPDLLQSEPAEGVRVTRRIPWHENAGRIPEAVHEQPAGVVDARRVGPAGRSQPPLLEPRAGRVKECPGHLVPGEIEEPEKAGAVPMVVVVQPVAERRDAYDGPAVTQGEEGGQFAPGGQERRPRQEDFGDAPGDGGDELRGVAEDILAAVLKPPQFGPGAAGEYRDAFGGFPRRRAGRHRLQKCGARWQFSRKSQARSQAAAACGSPCSWCG